MTATARARIWELLFRAGAIAGALPLFFARHLPFADLPEHLAVIATLRHWWTPEWRSQENFVVESALRTQYLLYDLVGAALAFPLGNAEAANVVMLAAVAIGFPYSLRALLRALGRDERLALIGVPLFWNRALGEGLIPFVASIPVAVWGLALFIENLRAPSRKRAIGLAVLAIVLFYLHLSSFLLLVAGAALTGMVHFDDVWQGRPRRFFRAFAWLVPAAIVAALFALASPVTHPDDAQGVHAHVVRFTPTFVLARELTAWMHDFWKTRADDGVAIVAWTGIAIAIVAGVRRARSRNFAFGAALFALALAIYFSMPSQVGFAFILDVRMAPFVGLFAALLAMPSEGRARELGAALVTAAALATGAVGAHQMAQMEANEARFVDEVLRNLPPGKRLLTLVFDPQSAYTSVAPYLHLGGYYRARYGGIASFSFAELPHWPVRYRPEAAPPKKPVVFWDFAPCAYRNTVDGPAYDYVLVRGEEAAFARGLPGPRFRLIGGGRDLRLYERIVGADTPGVDTLGPCGHAPPLFSSR